MKNLRLYLDYNATSPLASTVSQLLASGDFPFANPSSQHSSGKEARRSINEVSAYFKSVYSLSEYSVLYHSGATEGINLFCRQLEKNDIFIGFKSDHPAVTSQKKMFDQKNIKSFWPSLDETGNFPLKNVQEILNKHSDKNIFLNFTWVHNETGVVWPLDLLSELDHPNLVIHVDGVQSVAKTQNFLKLNPRASMYSFSGHKFGSLKSVGMSFIKNDLKLKPLFLGGSQQGGLRSGTENPLGIISLMYAHKEWCDKFDSEKMLDLKNRIILSLKNSLKENFKLIGTGADFQNVNTVDFIHLKMKADLLLAKFDMNGVEVSSGSACSSGQVQASQALESMGLGELSKNSIRISFSPFEIDKKEEILKALDKVFKK